MTRPSPRIVMPLVAVVLASAAAGLLGVARMRANRAPTVLPSLGAVPAFRLMDQHGERVSRDSLQGSVWIADFIFTRCAGQCPMMMGRMMELAEAFQNEPSIAFVSFTVDPEFDTPERLASYAGSFELPAARWHFLTGSQDKIWALSREGFKLGVGDNEASEAEPVTHSTRFVLVDQQGEIRGYYETTEPDAVERLRRDAQALVKHVAGS